MEQMMGIEPTLIAWEAIVLPLYDICICSSLIYGQNRNLCFSFYAIWTKCVFYWQPRQDSNLRIPESKSGALPLGDSAINMVETLRFELSSCKVRFGFNYSRNPSRPRKEGWPIPLRHLVSLRQMIMRCTLPGLILATFLSILP